MEGKRIDKYLVEKYADISRSKLQKMISRGSVFVNGDVVKASYVLKKGDVVEVKFIKESVEQVLPEKLALDVLRETDDYLIINKPAGMVVHPGGGGNFSGTVVNAVMNRIEDGVGEEMRPGIVHRLDKDTSGILIIAKTKRAYEHFVEQFKSRKVVKVYSALVFGSPEHLKGVIDAPIARDARNRKKMSVATERVGKRALSEYKVEETFEVDERLVVSLLSVNIKTGRTHQIRVHMKSIGHPVVMDTSYGNVSKNRAFKERFGLERQFLHAEKLVFMDLDGNKIEVHAKLSGDLQKVLDQLK